MASAIMNVVKEEIAISASTAASVTSTTVSAGRSTVSRSVAASAPSASARVATNSGVELLGGVVRNEAAHAAQVETQSVLANLSVAAAEGSTLSSVLGRTTNAESGTIRNVLPELREQISQAAQQGLEELMGDRAPRLEPPLSVAETAQKIEELIASK
ncbi:unnamed protein product [Rhizoctonia solani]|uniref:Uncharacterized protein n=1 Tax=Rhizoctonia solani TaxID=456999 RepID=A0A8H3H9G3_9AGAM|nr:unnamed protein product [Rhizoctonia solani]